MRSILYRIGVLAGAHPRRVIAAWLTLLAAFVVTGALVGGNPRDFYDVPDSPAQAGADFLADHFPELSGTDARVVVHSDHGALPADRLAEVSDRLHARRGVSLVQPPRLSADGSTALIAVSYDIPVTEFRGTEGIDTLRSAPQPLADAGDEVVFGGQVAENFTAPSGPTEAIGLAVASVILILAFGSVLAAGLPLGVALVGLGIGLSIVALMSAVTDVSTTAPTIATMVGTGVGIDYALLLASRFIEGMRTGLPISEATGQANATAGLSVICAGTTVLVSLLGLRLAGLPIYASFGFATLAVVGAVMLTSVTLVPSLCGLAGPRLLPRAERRALAARARGRTTHRWSGGRHRGGPQYRATLTGRWAARIGARPLPWAVAALALLVLLALPVLGMRTWPQDAGTQPDSATSRRAYDLTSEYFGPGANGPLVLAVDLSRLSPTDLAGLGVRLGDVDGIAAVSPPIVGTAGGGVIMVEPTTGPQDEATQQLLQRLRSEVLPPGVEVTGLTAFFADVSDRLAERLWLVIAFVVALSLLFLIVVFRSIVVAVKAAVMNMLSIAAAYGLMVMAFQWGWGAEILGLPHAIPVSSWVPILMFTILFGLSMDYHVFLLARVREDWLATGDARRSVVSGLASTGRIIASAAGIMVAVFIGFALDSDTTVKMMGFGMAVAVFIDASVVRMVLVPASMSLLGRANWWLPGWLDRLLPQVDLGEGGGVGVGRVRGVAWEWHVRAGSGIDPKGQPLDRAVKLSRAGASPLTPA